MERILRAGVAKVDITPAVGTELCGHFRSDLRSTGIHSNLYAKALVLESSEEDAVLVTCDLIGVTSTLVASTRERIEKLTGINGKDVMISCTHTHSGPGSMPMRVVGKSDEAYQDQLEKKIAGAVHMASRHMREVGIGFGLGNADLTVNRRVKWPNGSVRFDSFDPNIRPGPVDRDLGMITIKDLEGKTIAVVINYACHPVTMHGEASSLISSDYPGVATSLIEKVRGNETVAMFCNGPCGNINPYVRIIPGYKSFKDAKGDELTRTIGTMLGASALMTHETTKTSSQITIQTGSKTIRAPLRNLPTEEEIGKDMPELRRRPEDSWAKRKLDWYEYLLESYRKGKRWETHKDLEIQVLRFGDTNMVGLPGEVFCQIGLEIKRRARALELDRVLVVELANGNPGYIPAEEAYTVAPPGKRGYELEGSYMLYGRPQVAPGTATMIIEAALELIGTMKP